MMAASIRMRRTCSCSENSRVSSALNPVGKSRKKKGKPFSKSPIRIEISSSRVGRLKAGVELARIPQLSSSSRKPALVNWTPLSVLNISGGP